MRNCIAAFFLCVSLALTGCSVLMALSGKQEPDLRDVKAGSTREQVELQLGSPISHTTSLDGSSRNIYEYHTGNEPSLWRATGHGVMDFMTFGMWEIFGTPCELALGSEKKHQLLIVYGPDDSVHAISQIPLSKKKQTSPERDN